MKTILIVEDQLNFKKVLERFLIRAGYEVISCASGEAAKDLLRTHDFLVLITDFRLGRISGLNLAGVAKTRRPPIPTFIVSAYADNLNRSIWAHFPERIFGKPIDRQELLAAIKEIESREKVGIKK